jgi:hypothetical protein
MKTRRLTYAEKLFWGNKILKIIENTSLEIKEIHDLVNWPFGHDLLYFMNYLTRQNLVVKNKLSRSIVVWQKKQQSKFVIKDRRYVMLLKNEQYNIIGSLKVDTANKTFMYCTTQHVFVVENNSFSIEIELYNLLVDFMNTFKLQTCTVEITDKGNGQKYYCALKDFVGPKSFRPRLNKPYINHNQYLLKRSDMAKGRIQ